MRRLVRKLVDFSGWHRWRRRLEDTALPTLRILCDVQVDHMRRLGPILEAGATMEGFRACQQLGWARNCCDTDKPPGYGMATEKGRRIYEADRTARAHRVAAFDAIESWAKGEEP